MGFSEVSAPLTAEAQALGPGSKNTTTWVGLILAPHLASRRSGSARLLRSTRGPVLLVQRGRCGAPGGSGHFSFWRW